MQRGLDIILGMVALVVLSPLFVLAAIVLRLTGEGEVLYRQQRIGLGGQPFGLLKFATMLKNSPTLGTGTITVKGDPRILPLGRFLRSTKINELPQLLNIIIGDMSIIGPRPLTLPTFSAYPEEIQPVISAVKPGLSGLGSIIFRAEEDILAGEAASMDFYRSTIAPYKGEVEAWYARHRSIGLYIKAIILTALVVVRPRSNAVWRWFPGLPAPPQALRSPLNYTPAT